MYDGDFEASAKLTGCFGQMHPSKFRPSIKSKPPFDTTGTMNLVLPLCIVLACLPFFVQAQMNIDAGGVRINEFLTIPATSSSVGWIELHNPTGDAIDLTGCRVQDASASKDGVAIFTLASVVLQPGAFLLLLATGSTLPLDASAGASPGALETPLSLSGGGGKLFLMNEAGAVLSYVAYDIQFPAVSFGQRSAGLQRFGYFTAPSPGAANSDTSWACGFAVPPQLSVDRGFFASAFTLAVAAGKPPSKKKLIEGGAASAGALYEFRYTTDGSEPGPQSSAFDAAAPMTISTTTVMRVRAFINNAPCAYLPSPPTTKTYLFLDQVARQPNAVPNFPQSDRVYPTDFGAEPKRGLQINGELLADPTFLEQFRAGLSVIPSVSLVFDAQEMFGAGGVYDRQRSSSRRIRGSFEILYPDDAGLPNDASDVGINGHSWPMIKRSLSVSFSSKYANGAANPSPDFFNRNPNDPLGTSVKVVKINALNLIGGHNRAFTSLWTPQVTLTEDQLHRSLQIKAAGYGIHGRHCHVYLNGVYWGVHNAMETLNEKWAATTFGGDADDYFYIQDNKINQIAMSGDATDFNATMLATFADLGIEANYARVALLMDLKSFSQYLVRAREREHVRRCTCACMCACIYIYAC